MSRITREERYLLKFAELVDDSTETPLGRYIVGRQLSLLPHSTDVLVRDLMQTNFLRKGDEEGELLLTPHGLSLINTLRADIEK